MHIHPLKKYGQNFLIDKNIINKIIDEFNPQQSETILEIGPGRGALTGIIIGRSNNFFAVEIDKRIIDDLSSEYGKLKIISEDFLKLDLHKIKRPAGNKIRVIGNIPYNITTPIILQLIENHEIISDALLMVQLEAAHRFTAPPNGKEYGITTVLLDFFSRVKICFKVSPNVFFPRPKIESAVVHIYFDKTIEPAVDKKAFTQIVKASFGNRRKTLKNSLGNSIFAEHDFSQSGINLSKRAEELSTADFITLAKFIGFKK